jgi:Fic family protein
MSKKSLQGGLNKRKEVTVSGKPYQSKLIQYGDELFAMLDKGKSFRQVAEVLNQKYNLKITHNAVFSFVKTRRPVRRGTRLFFEGLSDDIRSALLKQIAAIWTHGSTAMEGNTLTLGETAKVLELGLTINGKPLRDHQEVYGHARAIDLIYGMIHRQGISENDLFDLHRAVMDKSAIDPLNPVGGWKRDFNGTNGVANGQSVYMEYADPSDVPHLMKRWLDCFNKTMNKTGNPADAIVSYVRAHMSFVRIHPFFDGNGRVARLVANLPVLLRGYPPIIIPSERRSEYIDVLWEYQNAVGRIKRGSQMLPRHSAIGRFKAIIHEAWRSTATLVDEARCREAQRNG